MTSQDPVALWAASGAMWLSGAPGDVPRVSPGTPALDVARALARFRSAAVTVPGLTPGPLPDVRLLGERAAVADLGRRGPVSAGGHARFLRCADGLAVLSLARDSDLDLLEALVEEPLDDATLASPWPLLQEWTESRGVAEVADRMRLLSLPGRAVQRPAATLQRQPAEVREGGLRATPSRPPRVVDLTSLWAGPLAAHLLSSAGARVVKVESRHRPDGARSGPRAFYNLMHHGHRGVSLDFTDADDRDRLLRLVLEADLVLEGSRPRALARLGLDADALVDHGVSWVSITAEGRDVDAIGFGDDVAAGAGLLAPGPEPHFVGDALADPLTGVAAAVAAVEALGAGRARMVDVSMLAVSRAALDDGTVPDHRVFRRRDQWWVETATGTHPVAPPQPRTPGGPAPDLGADDSLLAALLAGGEW